MVEIFLDRIGDAPVPPHCVLVTTEVDFLQHAPNPQAPLFVRGGRLCDWAESFYAGRQIPFQEAISPAVELRALCPALTASQCQTIYTRLQPSFSVLERPLSTSRLMNALFPSQLWQRLPSRDHAASYLLWLVEIQPGDWVQPLLAAQCQHWQTQSSSVDHVAYSVWDAGGAQILLDGWLGIPGSVRNPDLGEFPLDIPANLQERVRAAWRRKIVETQADCLSQLDSPSMLPALKQIVAKEAVAYYKAHPTQLSEQRVGLLGKYLSGKEQRELRTLLSPAIPTTLPTTAEDVLAWFQQEYLPYRLWQSTVGTAKAKETVENAARQFALWYLSEYPKSLMGGSFRHHLSFIRTAALSAPDLTVATLLIVLDGLHAADAQYLQLALQRQTPRLTTLVDGLAFTALPTITEFCKEALFKGVPPAQTEQLEPIGMILPENESPVQQLSSARKGSLYLWRVLEPDRTYHWRNTYDTLQREVEAQLEGVAMKIADIVEQVPADIPLRIVVTTDHGRLLARSVRTIAAPAGMKVHGRTAWGDGGRAYPASGHVIEDDLVFVHGERFGLRNDTAIILNEAAFYTTDGKTGSELFPHGGLYPEEVIIPWLIYARDVAQPQVEIEIHGRGQAGKRGEITIRVTNLDNTQVSLTRLTIHAMQGPAYSLPFDWQVAPSSIATQTHPLEPWPSAATAGTLRATASLQLVNGLTFEIDAQVDVQSEEMYQRENILEGLD